MNSRHLVSAGVTTFVVGFSLVAAGGDAKPPRTVSSPAGAARGAPAPSPAAGYSTLLPSRNDLSSPSSAPPSEQTQEIKNSRWIHSENSGAPGKPTSGSKGSNVSVTSSCTDVGGKTHAATDEGYSACIQQLSNSPRPSKGSIGTAEKKSGSRPGAGAEIKLKFED